MKRNRQFFACLVSAAILFSMLPVGFAAAQPQQTGDENTVQYEEGTYLIQDFEGDVPKVKTFYGSAPDYSIKTEKNGNKYLEISPNWGESGWELYQPITDGANDYVVKFDFALDGVRTDIPSIMLCEIAFNENASEPYYHHFGLIRPTEEGGFSIADQNQNVEGISYEALKWYSYAITFNKKSGKISGKISERDNPEVFGVVDFTTIDWIYGNGMPRSKTYDGFQVNCNGTILLDNIEVRESTEIPVAITAATEHTGNIFGSGDARTFTVNVRNKLAETVDAQIGYKILDEDGWVLETGEPESLQIEGKKKGEYSITVNAASAYGTYKVIFVGTVTLANGETKEVQSQPYMFSVVNKRAPGEALNKKTQSVTLSHYLGTQDKWEKVKELATNAGLGGIRTDLRWGQIQPDRASVLDRNSPDAAFADISYADMVNSGMENMAIIDMGNPYIYNGWNQPYSPHQFETETEKEIAWKEWEAYVDYITRAYKDEVTYWEVINEPNAFMSGAQYAEYLKRAYPIIRRNDPDAVICSFALSGVDLAWMEETFKVIGTQYMDIITVHPYDWEYSGEFWGQENWATLYRDQVSMDRINGLRELVNRYGGENIPFMFTEAGVSSTPPLDETYFGLSSLKMQAADLTQMFAMYATRKDVQATFWYSFLMTSPRGSEDAIPGDRNGNFGVVGNEGDLVPYAAKPAYVAMAGYNKMLTGAEYIDGIEHIDKDTTSGTRAYRFRRPDGKQVIVLWTENSAENIALNLGTDAIEVLDKYTNHIGNMRSAAGIYNFTSTFEPVFIVGDFQKFEQTESIISVDMGRAKAVQLDKAVFNFADKKGRNLRLEAKGTPEAQVTENTGIYNGSGRVVVETNAAAQDEEPIDVRIYEDDNLVYYGRLHLIIKDEAVSVSYTLGDDQTGAKDRKVVNVSVTNQTCGKELTGTVAGDFTDIGGKNEIRNIVGIRPKETKTVSLNVPKSSYVHSIGAMLDLEFDNGYHAQQEISMIEPINVLYNDTQKTDAAALDGDLSGGAWFVADDALATSFFTDWHGPADCSFKGTLRWDEKNLYIYCDVSDDVFYQPFAGGNVWQGDGLQIGIQDQNTVGLLDSAFTELAVSQTASGVEVYRYTLQNGLTLPMGLVEGIAVDIETEAGKTIYKIAIPWSETIGKETVQAGDRYRFNIIANDNDGTGRRGFAELTKGIGSSKNATLFTTITLNK